MQPNQSCPDCGDSDLSFVTRRQFVRTVGVTAAVASAAAWPVGTFAKDAEKKVSPENLVTKLYESLKPAQKDEICFDWDYTDDRGLLRTHVGNNWQVTEKKIASEFYTSDQQELIEGIFWNLYNRDWHDRIKKQLKDDADGYGRSQSIALIGQPGTGKFQFLMTGRHLTIRCDGDSAEHVAFGGPIFYGHAAKDFREKPDHPGNVYWPQALKANALYEMLDGKQRKQALVAKAPAESRVHFRGANDPIPGISLSELSADQMQNMREVLKTLVDPYRSADREEVTRCLNSQGGLENCRIVFFQSDDIGNDDVWDVWRLEGPSFVWHFRGAPHVHVWVNVADDPSVTIST